MWIDTSHRDDAGPLTFRLAVWKAQYLPFMWFALKRHLISYALDNDDSLIESS